jgi:hypothetical protein
MITICNRCLFTSEIAKISEVNGQCEYCDIHDELEKQSNIHKLPNELLKVSQSGDKYNCLIGISGGLDSSTLLYLAVKEWGLKPLVIHFDNNYNTTIANQNMDNLIKTLNVDAIIYRVNKKEYDDLNTAFRYAGTPDADIPNDIAMTKLMYETADKYGIKYILNGHDFREEGSTPRQWTYMDAEYIRSVYRWMWNKELTNYPLFTFKDQIYYTLKGIKQLRPFHYGFDRKKSENEMIKLCDWKSYGAKHCENHYTAFVGCDLLPNKFGIDKRIVYLSAKVRSNIITKDEAYKELTKALPFEKSIWKYTNEVRDRSFFKRYNFKRYRPLIWVLMKLKVLPYTFFVKYAK